MYRMLIPVYQHAMFAKSGLELFYVDWEPIHIVASMDEARAFARYGYPWIHNWVLERIDNDRVQAVRRRAQAV